MNRTSVNHNEIDNGRPPRARANRGKGADVVKSYGSNVVRTATPLLRTEIGDVLRTLRQDQSRTLREVSSQAQVSLGYLSEVERGQKEASSELLQAITSALGVPLWFVLREVSDRMAVVEGTSVPNTIPDDLMPVALLS